MFKLPKLSYSYKSLEPYIDEETMQIHHTKHHSAYVENLNKALAEQKELLNVPIEKLLSEIDKVPKNVRQVVINNGGGHANHSLFWTILTPKSTGKPSGDFMVAIKDKFGSFEKFKESFSNKAMTVFGSGWAFLIIDADGSLAVKRQSFQNSPYMYGNVPILGLDVWEHAYYLKYQNRRADYVKAWWNIINWRQVENNFSNSSR